MADYNATDAMSRRNGLKATGGLLAGTTTFAGSGVAETEAEPEPQFETESEPEPQFEIEDANEEVIDPGARPVSGVTY
ncbi:hypothetical protein HTZ84_09300 [Haloterrigena sp. SYSU A558-1]|uniref:Uncharacterized protein n=1 Tax=Haloterrigena gelatinilytica TaxID=2741724 RepID=A0A8J8GQH0_9EURY|nr:hypothetical protein [Haloterrigena gelatinilytica]NUB91670.1 hypothetical protein [Haloterrigena gelatinilytica]NUC72501.1 hypothetical protein [Haloterrigena gelatinilytica]